MNFVEFPDIIPSSMDFIPPRFPVGSDTSLGGVSTRRKFGNRQYDGRLTVEFRNISNFMCAQVLLLCHQSKGIAPIAFKSNFFSGAGDELKLFLDCSAYPGLLWYFIEDAPPRISRVEGGAEVSNMSLELAAKLLPDSTGASIAPVLPDPLPSGGGPIQPVQRVSSVSGQLPISSTEGTDPVISIAPATEDSDGSMSAADKSKLDSIQANAQQNVPTNLDYDQITGLLSSSTGAGVTLPLFSSIGAGLAPASEGGTNDFLRADGTWAEPIGGNFNSEAILNILYERSSVTNSTSATSLPTVNPTQIEHFNSSMDEGHVAVDIGFDVIICGRRYGKVFINSNSYFTFGSIVDNYGYETYYEWASAIPFTGVFVGAGDRSLQILTSTGPQGTTGQRTNTIRFQGSAYWGNSDPAQSDIIWEITFKEQFPSKIFLKILAFNDEGGTEGVDFFTFSSAIGTINADAIVSPFICQTGAMYEITLAESKQMRVRGIQVDPPYEAGTVLTDILHDWSSPYSYIGRAQAGTPQTDATWAITRIQVNSNGTTSKLTATGAWTNRANLF